ncbi:Arm DNA-binding domain-containing protein [Enterobacter sp. ECC-175]|uniref:Arm DNA-binding domain-containing protein n=1 Tax=unclassified Enterobacter TaxID=2608935 RepID=UPI0032C23785
MGVRVFPSGRKTFVYRYFVDKEGKRAKFNTLGVYPEMSFLSALETFESLANCPDVVKVTKKAAHLPICLKFLRYQIKNRMWVSVF